MRIAAELLAPVNDILEVRSHRSIPVRTRLATTRMRLAPPTLFVLIPASFQVQKQVFYDYVRGCRIDSTPVDINQASRGLCERYSWSR